MEENEEKEGGRKEWRKGGREGTYLDSVLVRHVVCARRVKLRHVDVARRGWEGGLGHNCLLESGGGVSFPRTSCAGFVGCSACVSMWCGFQNSSSRRRSLIGQGCGLLRKEQQQDSGRQPKPCFVEVLSSNKCGVDLGRTYCRERGGEAGGWVGSPCWPLHAFLPRKRRPVAAVQLACEDTVRLGELFLLVLCG